MNNKENKKQVIDETEELGSWTKEMIKPENLDPHIFHSVEDLTNYLLSEEK